MRIALKVGTTYYPLAGEAGVSERDHTSAADFQLSAQAEKQIIPRVRASHVQIVDRGNLMHTVRFTSSRQFATPAEAFLATLDHDASMPRAGVLVLDAVAPDGGIYRRLMASAVVTPPARRVIGATALYDYSVDGGAITDGGYTPPNITGRMIVAGGAPATANGTYEIGSIVSGKQSYYKDANVISWYTVGGGYWGVSPSPLSGGWSARSASDTERPDQATGWYRADTLAAVPGFTITAETA